MRIRTIILAASIPCVLAGMILTSSGTSTQQSVITIKPAVPKYTITKAFYNEYMLEENMEFFIRTNVRKGYVVKNIAMTDHRSIVIMEKY